MGLLIAIGLEQSVEALHRHSERRELERNLRREAKENVDRLEISRHSWAVIAKWSYDSVGILRTAPQTHGVIAVTLPARPETGGSSSPVQSVWTVAKSNGTLSLLPEGDAEVFEHVAYDADQEEAMFAAALKQELAEATLETQFGVHLEPSATLHVTVGQSDSLVAVLAAAATADDREARWLAACEGADAAVVAGAKTREEMNPYIERYVHDTMR